MLVHPDAAASAIARTTAASRAAAEYIAAIKPNLRTSRRSLLDRVDSPQQEAGALTELAGARRDIGTGSPGRVALVAEVIFELHFLLGGQLAVLFAVVVVGRLLDGRALRIECGTSLSD